MGDVTFAFLSSADAGAQCWGHNQDENCGAGGNGVEPRPIGTPFAAATEVATGGEHTCGLWPDGTVQCVGVNGYGELGDGMKYPYRLTLGPVSGLSNAVHLCAGYFHTCAVLTDGTAECWGDNQDGELGDGTQTMRLLPTPVTGLTNVDRMACGETHTCALLKDGTVSCWGKNTWGNLGDGTTTSRLTAAAVPGLSNVVELGVGSYHSCAHLADDSVECWGDNGFGELGDGTMMQRPSPTKALLP
jgi:alpha-tubulin suppressor-like RCC1 family protein